MSEPINSFLTRAFSQDIEGPPGRDNIRQNVGGLAVLHLHLKEGVEMNWKVVVEHLIWDFAYTLRKNDELTARATKAESRAVEAEALLSAVRWVPVEERLPEVVASHGHSHAVQVWLGDHAANFTAFYSGSSWYRWGQPGKLKNVSHWRALDCNSPVPLPSSPAAALPRFSGLDSACRCTVAPADYHPDDRICRGCAKPFEVVAATTTGEGKELRLGQDGQLYGPEEGGYA